ncbi:glutaredoxin family protein [Cellulomonas sp. URHE0023]|uniref:glutaredoxin family protein n=1 Tax=Cellulomonas sp. URHE0023 TaxID=1380354 RepID=UPI0004821580|nr:glutaredoxin family protein [Cellulomonas sp. URHE0023]
MTNTVQTRVVLYGRSGCHLCDDARDVVRSVCAETGSGWTEVDIEAGPYEGRDLVDELGELVPVVEVDGVQQGYWRIDAARLRRTLTGPGSRPLP